MGGGQGLGASIGCLRGRSKGRAAARQDRQEDGGQQEGMQAVEKLEHAVSHLLPLHGVSHLIERLDGVVTILSVNEDGPAEQHILSQQRSELELLLSHDAGHLGEYSAQVQDVHTRLMIPYKDSWPSFRKVLLARHGESHARERSREEVEGASDDVVDIETLSYQSHEY